MPSLVDSVWRVERVDHAQVPLLVATVTTDDGAAVACVSLGADREKLAFEAKRAGATLSAMEYAAPSQGVRELREYLDGSRREFDVLLAPSGTSFERDAWDALVQIPFGDTRSYGQQARSLGRPNAARAVGRANACNPIPILIPCHRVIGHDGSLTGFGGGLPMKRWLLAHENPQRGLFADARAEAAAG